MQVTAMANGMFDVTSERDETVSYVVDLGRVCCTCPDWVGRRNQKELTDPDRRCKHMRKVESQPQPTKLSKALAVAEQLSDADLKRYAAEKAGTAAGCACILELAARAATAQPQPIPAGVLALLQGATDAERERALRIYR